MTATDPKSIPSFSDRCYAEATRDVVFLFQVCLNPVRNSVRNWNTERVFLSREEAEDFGRATQHRYPGGGKGVGWRVYGVPSEGRLAELVRGT